MRVFLGVEGGDFFCFVEKLHRTFQKHPHGVSLTGIGAIVRFLRELKDHPIEGDGVIVGQGALLFEAQRLIEQYRAGFSPGGVCLGRLGEPAVMFGPIAIEHRLSLLRVLALANSQFTDEPGRGKFPTVSRSYLWPEGNR